MTKIEGLRSLVKQVFGKNVTVDSTDCGQKYFIRDPKQGYLGMIFIDTLKGGRVSLKIKHCPHIEADRLAKTMWNWLYYFSEITVDAASKADVYWSYPSWGGHVGVKTPRLICDKWW